MTITPIPLPDDQEPDLFDLPPGPAPEQLELFTEDGQVNAAKVQATVQRASPTSSVDTPPAGR